MKTSDGRSGSALHASIVVGDEMGRRGIGGKSMVPVNDVPYALRR